MIATLQGTVAEKISDETIILAYGVGYGVIMPTASSDKLQINDEIKVYVYEHIKEDAHTLFGFLSLSDKQLFEQLLRVKNVGPKVAMAVLDIGNASAVRTAIASGDVKRLQTAKGVGKRAAEQIIVELRDKMGLLVSSNAEDIVTRSAADLEDEALQALVSLGYTEADASLALKSVGKDLPTEERIKQALRTR
jgi:Holliday junction DNA helicase RuvA